MITLKTLEKATEQEVFDQVAKHLISQNKRCQTPAGQCLYVNSAQLKCAAGCLISDEEYIPEFEGNGWEELLEQGLVPEWHKSLIIKLQKCHDTKNTEDWRNELIEIGREFKLNYEWLINQN